MELWKMKSLIDKFSFFKNKQRSIALLSNRKKKQNNVAKTKKNVKSMNFW